MWTGGLPHLSGLSHLPGAPSPPCKQALRSTNADGNENVKKKKSFISKTTTLQAHHTHLYIYLPVFARLRRENAEVKSEALEGCFNTYLPQVN